jgi:hypothetical protein
VTVSIEMGRTGAGVPAALDLEELLATRLLVQGNSGSGKSHLLRRLVEQSAAHVQQAVIDPEGDFVTLAEAFGHVVVDAAQHNEAALQRVGNRVRHDRISVVLNVEGLDAELQMRRAAAFLGGLFETEREAWYPVLVVVDEAQLFAPAVAGEVSDEARKASLGAMTNLMCRGRKRGLAGIIATQRLAKLAKNVAAEASNFLMGRTFLDIDMARAADLLGMDRRQAEMFRDLERGHFVALGPALSKRPLPIRVGEVRTSPRAGSPKLMPLPERAPENARERILEAAGAEPPRPIVVRRAPPPPAPDPIAEIARAASIRESAPAAERRPAPSEPVLDEILRETLAEPESAFRSVAVLYQDFLVRCRIRRLRGEALDLAAFRRRLALARIGVASETAATSEWQQVLGLAGELPEDMHAVFLLLARAALDGAPSPSDLDVARTCGSHSPKRARRLLAWLEERGVIVCRETHDGGRIVALPDIARETAPGDPHRAEAGMPSEEGMLAAD